MARLGTRATWPATVRSVAGRCWPSAALLLVGLRNVCNLWGLPDLDQDGELLGLGESGQKPAVVGGAGLLVTEDNRPLGVGVKKKVAGWLMALARIAVLNPELFRMAVEDAHRMYGEQVKNEYPWNQMVGAYAADVCADSVEAGGDELVRGSGHGARGGVAVCAGGGCGEFRSGGYLGGHGMGPPGLRLPMAPEIPVGKTK